MGLMPKDLPKQWHAVLRFGV